MKINLISVFKLLITLLAVSMILLCYSCGSVKKDKTKTEEVTKTENSNNSNLEKKEESNVKITENTIIDDKNETVIEETNYEPIDNTKPATIIDADGKETKLNNSKKTTRKTTHKNNTKTDNSKNSDEFYKSELSEQSESKGKTEAKKEAEAIQVDRKAWSVYNLLWLLIPIAIVYLAWKNKAKIITWFNGLWWISWK